MKLPIVCGVEKKEVEYPSLSEAIDNTVSLFTQSEPKHRDTKGYIKITASQVHQTLVNNFGYSANSFCISTINHVLNRLGYTLKKVKKTQPLKRIAATDQIFEQLHACTQKALDTPDILRISVDVKDKVKVGALSRGGYSRNKQAVAALDKDQHWEAVLVPVGVLEVASGVSTIVFGNSRETTDLIVDTLETWVTLRADELKKYTHIQINLDNGPHVHSRRTQFIKRVMQLACQLNKTIELVYYPPYHSKYNPIERVWAALEHYWNGTLLNTVEKTIATAKMMTWKKIHPLVEIIDKQYQTGIKLTKKEMDNLEKHLIRNQEIPKWHVLIKPNQNMRNLFFN